MSKNTDKPKNNVAFAEGMREREMAFKPDQVNVGVNEREKPLDETAPRTVGAMAEQFPTDGLTAYDPMDRMMAAKLQLSDPENMGYTPFGKLEAKDSDFQWYQRKQAALEVAQFERWFAKQFDMMDPAQKQRAKELYPQFYAARKKTLKRNAKNLIKLARIKLEGPSNLDDVKLLYLVESGRLNLGPLQDLLHPEKDAAKASIQQTRLIRGLANPFQMFGKQAYPNTVDNREKRVGDYANLKVDKSFVNEANDVNDKEWFTQLTDLLSGAQITPQQGGVL